MRLYLQKTFRTGLTIGLVVAAAILAAATVLRPEEHAAQGELSRTLAPARGGDGEGRGWGRGGARRGAGGAAFQQQR